MVCKNCEIPLNSESDYCHKCGGRIIRKRLTLKNLFQHLSETFFNYDNKLLRTIISLITKPEDVVGSYVDGTRKKYVTPVSFFGLSLTLTGLSIFIIKKFYIQYFDYSEIFDFNNGLPKEVMNTISEAALEYSSLIYSLLIPAFALISYLIFLNKKYNFTEHIVLYLYSMSLFSLTSVIIGQLILIIIPKHYFTFGILLYFVVFFYHCYLLKRLFKLSIGELLLKSLLFLLLFFILYIGLSIAMVVVLFLSGSVNLQDFAPK